ncbi:MmyB family transcriptional regulator [Streptomyces sp. NPDC001617]
MPRHSGQRQRDLAGTDPDTHHPEVGDLTLGHQAMQLEGTPGHRELMFFAEPGTPDHDAIVLLDLLGQQRAAQGAAAGPAPAL